MPSRFSSISRLLALLAKPAHAGLVWILVGVCALAFASASCGNRAGSPPATAAPGADLDPVITLTPGLVLERVCVPAGPELCFNAIDDNCNGVLDEGCGVRTGLVQFSIAWGEADADVDLEVTDPSGELVEVGRVSDSGLIKERDCPGTRNECLGQNLENVFLEEGEPVRGKYVVVVRLEKLGAAAPPLEVTLGARVGPKTYAARIKLQADDDHAKIVFDL